MQTLKTLLSVLENDVVVALLTVLAIILIVKPVTVKKLHELLNGKEPQKEQKK